MSGFIIKIVYWFQIVSLSIGTTPYGNSSHLRVSRQASPKGCILPPYPELGKWTIYQSVSQLSPGQTAPLGTVLQVTCKPNYKPEGDATIVCINGHWTSEIGKCLRTCPPLYTTSIMTVTCTYHGRKLETCDEAIEETKAKFQCADFYEDQSLDRHPVHVCYNGRWSHRLPECVPICGRKATKKDPTAIVGGTKANKGEYPWQVALYNTSNKALLCGGSLLNQRVILTAAHCITNENGVRFPQENYIVAVGKYYRLYDHQDDRSVQYSTIHKIFIPRQYKGYIQNYFGDIALIITQETFRLATNVQPVCVDWGIQYHQSLLDPTRLPHGYVSGWGYTVEHKNPSEVLKELKVPIITDTECNTKMPDDYTRFLTDDKLCAGFLDSSTSVCKGDSGGGLVYEYKNRFYVVAVVSLSPQAPTVEGGCDSQQYALYTRVSYYVDSFILEIEAKYRPSISEEIDCSNDPNCKLVTSTTTSTTTLKPVINTLRGDCTLPEHPKQGKWSVFGITQNLSPGTFVAGGTILRIACNQGYQLNGGNVTVCENGKWVSKIGECLKACPTIRSTQTTQITCTFRDEELKTCSNVLDGTRARYKCAPFYEIVQFATNPVRVCINGSWDATIPECVPICGLKSVTPQTLIINGNIAKQTEYPWQVAIYKGAPKKFICGGSLISQRTILSAAHCISDYEGKLGSPDDYRVGVGKYYSEYYHPLDHNAQFSEIEKMFIPLEYSGLKGNYHADIAVLITKNTLTLSTRVQPACVDWSLNYVNSNISTRLGYISGWGYTIPGSNPSDELRYLEVPIISNEQCYTSFGKDFQPFLTSSKFCAGYLNKNISVCNGDAGGGLVTKHDGRYYITGILSSAPSDGQGRCDSQKYATYTKVASYNNFILEKDAQFKPTSSATDEECNGRDDSCSSVTTKPQEPSPESRSSCKLPQHPPYGKWQVYGTSSDKYLPGMVVITGTLLQIVCYESYKLEGNNIILCENGMWSGNLGRCILPCPAIQSNAVLKATCFVNDKEVDNCTESIDGTKVKYECAPFYEDPALVKNPIHTCKESSWDHPPPTCIPVCGQKSVSPQILIINGTTAHEGNYPWHVGIYRNDSKEFICSGTIVNELMVVTAAQCVTDLTGKAQSLELFSIAAGKFYRLFNDSRDSKSVQVSKLYEIKVHQDFKGFSQQFFADIALLILKTPLNFSHTVQPICVDWKLTHEKFFNSNNWSGYVTGWGYTNENQNPAEKLQELEVPAVPNGQCLKELPTAFASLLTSDKFCAGYRNNGTSVCLGDSGGPLAVKFDTKYYFVGIVDSASLGPNGGCDSQNYAVYTKIYSYVGFIAAELKKACSSEPLDILISEVFRGSAYDPNRCFKP